MNLIRQGATSYLVTVSCPCSLQPSGVVLWPCLWSCSYIYTFHFYEFLAEPRPSLHWELGLTAIIVFSFLAVRSHAHLHFVLFPFKTQCCLEDAMGHSANISVKYKQMYKYLSPMSDTLSGVECQVGRQCCTVQDNLTSKLLLLECCGCLCPPM